MGFGCVASHFKTLGVTAPGGVLGPGFPRFEGILGRSPASLRFVDVEARSAALLTSTFLLPLDVGTGILLAFHAQRVVSFMTDMAFMQGAVRSSGSFTTVPL